MKRYDRSTWCIFWLFLWCGLVTLIILALALSANAQEWQWSPAAEHHRAIVEIQSGQRGCSGVYVQQGQLRGVLTVAHGVGLQPTAKVTWSDGRTEMAAVTIDKFKHDLGLVFATHPTIKPLRVAAGAPRIGERVEFVTYGGPASQRLRHFFGHVAGVGDQQTKYSCYVVSGDSGGAILNAAGEVIGVQATAERQVASAGGWPIYQGGCGASCAPIRAFLQRIEARCRGGWCPRAQPRGRIELYPPTPPIDIAELPKVTPPEVIVEVPGAEIPKPRTPEIPPLAEIDYDRLAAVIYAKVEANLEQFKGPKGEPGPPGPPGKEGAEGAAATIDYDALARAIIARLPPQRVQWERLDGTVIYQEKPLGEPLRFKSVEIDARK